MPVQIRAIGNVQALATVSVLSMINGEVMKVHFAEGHEVAAGALLFTIDPRQLQSALLQAQATLAGGSTHATPSNPRSAGCVTTITM